MKILFVTLSSTKLNTSAMIRNNALVYGLIENGHDIDLLTLNVSERNPYYDNTLEWPNEVNIIELKGNQKIEQYLAYGNIKQSRIKAIVKPFLRKGFHALSIFDNTISYTKKINFKDIETIMKTQYDLVISSSDPKSSHVFTEKLIENGLKFKKWIQYWGDPLTMDITRKNIYPQFISKIFEKRIFSSADEIVYVSPFTLQEQQISFPRLGRKMSFLPISYKKEKGYIEKVDKDFLKLGYFGDYNSKTRNILPLYNAITSNSIKHTLLIAGNSNLNLKGNTRIEIFPRIKSQLVTEREEKVDVLICILNKNGTQIPGKMYHYAATRKPILVILDGDNQSAMKMYLESFNRFIICENNEESILSEIKRIKESSLSYRPSPDLDSTVIAKRLIDIALNN